MSFYQITLKYLGQKCWHIPHLLGHDLVNSFLISNSLAFTLPVQIFSRFLSFHGLVNYVSSSVDCDYNFGNMNVVEINIALCSLQGSLKNIELQNTQSPNMPERLTNAQQ